MDTHPAQQARRADTALSPGAGDRHLPALLPAGSRALPCRPRIARDEFPDRLALSQPDAWELEMERSTE